MKTLLERISQSDKDTLYKYYKTNYPNVYADLLNDLTANTNFGEMKLSTAYDIATGLECKLSEVIFIFSN